MLSDIVMFSAFFATYAVLVSDTAGGPNGWELFDLRVTRSRNAGHGEQSNSIQNSNFWFGTRKLADAGI